MVRQLFPGILLLVLGAGCAAPSEVQRGARVVLKANEQVTLEGTARDAHSGAVVVLRDRQPLYVEGLERWPAELEGKNVKVSGTVVSRKLAPDPVVAADGAVSAGMVGESWVLTSASWALAAP